MNESYYYPRSELDNRIMQAVRERLINIADTSSIMPQLTENLFRKTKERFHITGVICCNDIIII